MDRGKRVVIGEQENIANFEEIRTPSIQLYPIMSVVPNLSEGDHPIE